MTDKIDTSTAPERIWLQLDIENGQPLEDATWCADQIEDYDAEYVRADIAHDIAAERDKWEDATHASQQKYFEVVAERDAAVLRAEHAEAHETALKGDAAAMAEALRRIEKEHYIDQIGDRWPTTGAQIANSARKVWEAKHGKA